jgi:hypothetical protein
MTAFLGHEADRFVVDDKTSRDWYRCKCGETFGGREWKGTCPHPFGPTFEEHVLSAEGLSR